MPELTEPQIKQYNTYRAEGMPPERALMLATKNSNNEFNPALEKGVDNILFGEGSLTQALGRGLKEAATGGFREVAKDYREHGFSFAAKAAPIRGLGAVGRGAGEVFGGLLETADDLTGEVVSEFAMPYVEQAMNTDVAKYLTQRAVELDQKGRGIPGDILDAMNLLPPVAAARPAVALKDLALKTAREATERASATRSSLADFLARRRDGEVDADGKPVVQERTEPLEDVIKDASTGKTTENIPSMQRPFVKEDNLLTPAEKKRLLGVQPEAGNRYVEAFKASEADDTAPSIFDVAVEDTLKAVEKYKQATKATGSEIGKIKDKLTTLPVDPTAVSNVIEDLIESLRKKNVTVSDEGQLVLVPGKNSPFSQSDVAALNDDVMGSLRNIEKSGEMNELLLAIEALDSKINFSKEANVSSSLQGVAKKIRGKLKEVRDSALTPEEAKAFEAYSNAIAFADEFLKSDSRVSVLLNRLGTKHSRDSQAFVKELQRVTGIDVQDFAALARILTEATVGSGRNKSLLQQHLTNAGLDVSKLTSPSGILDTVVGGTIRAALDVDKLKEIQKAINTVVKPKAKPAE